MTCRDVTRLNVTRLDLTSHNKARHAFLNIHPFYFLTG